LEHKAGGSLNQATPGNV